MKHASKVVPQAEVRDELDYALSMVIAGNLSPENKEVARKLAKAIKDEIKLCNCDNCEVPDCNCSGEDCNDAECLCKCHGEKRFTGSDMLEINKTRKELVKAAMDKCQTAIDCMDAHHKAHNVAHKAHKEALQSALDTLTPMAGDMPDSEPDADDKSILAAFQTK